MVKSMSKRILLTSTDLMMIQFMIPHIYNFVDHGWHVEIACSVVGDRIDEIREKLKGKAVIHTVRLHRSPANPENLKGYQDMKQVINNGEWDIIWTNEPVMGVVTRLAARKARKKGTKVIYMVHGFHFYKGAPILNWMVFYPVERIMAHFADAIVTINKDDFERAKTFHTKEVRYIHGIGVNTNRLDNVNPEKNIRKELGIPESACFLLSIGELNKNKNHRVIIEALGSLQDKDIYYAICGKGDMKETLLELAAEKGIQDRFFLLGYRMDIVDICMQADVFVFPSIREGLPQSPLEAMYCGLPVISTNSGGIKDYVIDGVNGYLCEPTDAQGFANAIRKLKEDKSKREQFGKQNKMSVVPFCFSSVKDEVLDLFESFLHVD